MTFLFLTVLARAMKFINDKSRSNYLFDNYSFGQQQTSLNKSIFITGLGRSGTHFLSELFALTPECDSYHLDDIGNPTADSFWQYVRWNELPVGDDSFIDARRYIADKVHGQKQRFVESNPYLSLSIQPLSLYFPQSTILIAYRNPEAVIASHYRKGWYKDIDYKPRFEELCLGFNYSYENAHHNFGRIVPKSTAEFNDWIEFSRSKKIAWMLRAIHQRVITQSLQIDSNRLYIINIDEFSYENYIRLANKLDLKMTIDEEAFTHLKNERPGKDARNTLIRKGLSPSRNEMKEALSFIENLDFLSQFKSSQII